MLDLSYLKEITGHDKTLLDTLLQQFLATTGDDLINLEKAIQQHKISDIKSISHRIKGAATTVGADELKNLTAELEKSTNKNADYYNDIYHRIQSSFQAIIFFINTR